MSSKNIKRVVVVGSRGFVGQELVRWHQRAEYSVLGISSKEIDLLESSSAEKISQVLEESDSIVFVSALTPDRGRDLQTLLKNLTMLENLIHSFKKKKPAHVVAIGSDAVYSEASSLVNEQTPTSPTTLHGVMHLTREIVLKQVCKEIQVPLMILRPSAIFGLRDTHNAYGPNRFLNLALKGEPISLFGAGEEKRDHVYIEDLCKLTELVLLDRREGELNAVSGMAISFMEAAQTVKSLVQKDIEIKVSPRANPITHRHFETTRLAKLYPEFKSTTLAAGLKKVLDERLSI